MKIRVILSHFVVMLSFVTVLYSCKNKRYDEGLAPEEAIKRFELVEGFTIEVFASEPNVMDPVEMVFDEQGNVYVVEMGDYPYKPESGRGKGKIRILKDEDGDGVIDHSAIFAEGLPDATSILPWEGGLIVTSAPDILYLKDTTGDGIADTKEVLFTGFFENNSEAQITSLRYGIDNWIYANNGGQRGEIKFNRRPEASALSVAGGDFRFRLDKNLFEVESGLGQFGLTMDDWGNRFFTQNTRHIQMAPIPWRYLYRHDHLPSYNGVSNIYAHDLSVFQISEAPHWRIERSRQRQEQYDNAGLDRVEHVKAHFTGATGGTLYAADLFPESFYGNVFTGDVACNIVHRDVIVTTENAPFFSARRDSSEIDREFLASTDTWFRPVNFTVGPDGALYVLDMYRQHIETPVSIPDELKKDMDFTYGNQYGRIYRIYPDHKQRPALQKPTLRGKSNAQLVEILSHHEQWWRLQAQRLLIERKNKSVVTQLEELHTNNADPRTRLHALYTLEGLDALKASTVQKSLDDVDAQVRRHAILLSERYPELAQAVAQKVEDKAPQTAFQATLSLGQLPSKIAVPALTKVVLNKHIDDWFMKAVLSSEAGSSIPLLQQLLQLGFFHNVNNGKEKFMSDFSYVLGARGDVDASLTLLNALSSPELREKLVIQEAIMLGFSKGVEKADIDASDKIRIREILRRQESNAASKGLRNAISKALVAIDQPTQE